MTYATDQYFKALNAREWADLQRRHLARGGESVVRADSGLAHGERPMDAQGLFVNTHFDNAGRPIRTFELPPGQDKRSTWLAPFLAPIGLQVALTNNVHNTRKQGQAYLNEHPEAIKV